MRIEEGYFTSFEIELVGRSAKRWSRTSETTRPPWQCPIRTTFVTVGSSRKARTWS